MTGFPSFAIFLQVFINGVLLGCMYGVAAIGLSLIFGCMQIVFIAHGAVMILAAYCIYWMVTLTSMNPFLGFLLIIPVFSGVRLGPVHRAFPKVGKGREKPIPAFGIRSHDSFGTSHVFRLVTECPYRDDKLFVISIQV